MIISQIRKIIFWEGLLFYFIVFSMMLANVRIKNFSTAAGLFLISSIFITLLLLLTSNVFKEMVTSFFSASRKLERLIVINRDKIIVTMNVISVLILSFVVVELVIMNINEIQIFLATIGSIFYSGSLLITKLFFS